MIDPIMCVCLFGATAILAYLWGRSDGYVHGWRDALKPKKKE